MRNNRITLIDPPSQCLDGLAGKHFRLYSRDTQLRNHPFANQRLINEITSHSEVRGARRADALARTRLRLIDSSRLAARFSSSGWRVGVPRRRPRDGADTAYVSCARFPESRRTSAKHGSWQAACRRRSAVARRAMADTVICPKKQKSRASRLAKPDA
jgi:hypothetical protein